MNVLDKYYKRPILYDYILSLICIGVIYYLDICYELKLINQEKSENLSSELGAIGLTISGFILTLATILLTLKTNQLLTNKKLSHNSSPFEVFLSSPLYTKSINILKYAVLSLIVSSIILYLSKIILQPNQIFLIYYLNINAVIIISTTFMRCFYVINLVLKMQETKLNESDPSE